MPQVAFGLSVHLRFITILGQVFPRPISANPWLKFVLSFFIPLFKSLRRITFSIPLRASNYQILDKKILLIFLLKLSGLKSDFTLTLGYINPTTNNPALINKHHLISLYFFSLSKASCSMRVPLFSLCGMSFKVCTFQFSVLYLQGPAVLLLFIVAFLFISTLPMAMYLYQRDKTTR